MVDIVDRLRNFCRGVKCRDRRCFVEWTLNKLEYYMYQK